MNYDDGVLTLHQSDIKDYIKCPEQARRKWAVEPDGIGELTGRVETDAASIGTVLHTVIESELQNGFVSRKVDLQRFGRNCFGELIQEYMADDADYIQSSYGDDPAKVLAVLDALVESWFVSKERKYWKTRDPGSFDLERKFNVAFLERPSGSLNKQVRLAGQIDIVDREMNELDDWKTSGRPYQRWEHQRFDPQPTVYTFAAVQEGWITPVDGLTTFKFKVFLKKGIQEVQTVEVQRGQGQWSWLTELVNNIAIMVESGAPSWPLRDDGWWCSSKWCPFFNDCKGVFVTEDWT